MNTTEKEKWDKIIQTHISCTCGEIYLSRNLTAPDCPYHANDWESPMEEFLKELKEEPKGLRWVKCSERLPDDNVRVFIRIERNGTMNIAMYDCDEEILLHLMFGSFVPFENTETFMWKNEVEWLEETPTPSEEAAQNIKP